MSEMMDANKIWRLFLILATGTLLFAGMVNAQEKLITDIKVVGNERITTDAIMAIVPLKTGSPYSEQAIQDSQKAIEDMGYFERVIVGTEDTETGLRVVFNVVENPVVKEIKITGNTVFTTEQLMSLLRTTTGTVLNIKTLMNIDIPAIERFYDDAGYIAYVTDEVGIDPATGVLHIPILEVRVEDIRIEGNKKTKTFVILREMQLKKGDVFNRNVLFSDIRRIYDLDIFDRETAEPYRLAPGSDLGSIIITIPVKERKTGELSLGIGYSSREKVVGQARISEKNFRGMAQSINASWEQSAEGGASYELGFYEPWLDKKHTSLNLNLYNKVVYRFTNDLVEVDGETDDYDERRKGGSATVTRPLGKHNTGAFTLRSESVDSELQSSKILYSNGNITSGTARFMRSTRDSEIEPTTGAYTSYAVEVGNADFDEPGIVNGIEGDNTFAKYNTDIRLYFSKKPKGKQEPLNTNRKVVALRLMAGSLSGDVPFFEQYFLGGAESLRGYKEDRFWGKNIFLASAEYRIPLGQSLIGVLFVDCGDAWGARDIYRDPENPTLTDDPFKQLLIDMPQHEDFSPSVGYGLGIRVATPIGPLRLDYGFGEDGSRAHFSIGHVF